MLDIAIIGAGPVGALFALAMKARGSAHDVLLLDAASPTTPPYVRTLALAQGSRLLLERIGVWQRLRETPQPIETIDVTQRDGVGHALIRATECGVQALGYTLMYADLKHAMDAALAEAGIAVHYNAKAERITVDPHCATVTLAPHDGRAERVDAALIAVADGGSVALPGMHAFTRDHGHTAVLAHVVASKPLPTMAFERFSTQGPIALLPLDGAGKYGLVWTHAHERAADVAALPEGEFIAALKQALGETGAALGALTLASAPKTHRLGLKYMEPRVSPRIVAIGNAAQAMHPIAGQGLNLGFRDAWALAEHVAASPRDQLGRMPSLMHFAFKRGKDRLGGVLMTESLVSIFGLETRFADLARGIGIGAMDAVAPIKRRIARRMMFGG